jgi:hypothetical protein
VNAVNVVATEDSKISLFDMNGNILDYLDLEQGAVIKSVAQTTSQEDMFIAALTTND